MADATYTPGVLEPGELDSGTVYLWMHDTSDPDDFGNIIATVTAEDVGDEACVANARRLAACWEALGGVSTEAVEGGAVRRLVEAARRSLGALACAVEVGGGNPAEHLACRELREALAAFAPPAGKGSSP